MDIWLIRRSDALNGRARRDRKARMHNRQGDRYIYPVRQPIGEIRGGLADFRINQVVRRDDVLYEIRISGWLMLENSGHVLEIDIVDVVECEELLVEPERKLLFTDGFGALAEDRAEALRRPRIHAQRLV